MEAPCSDQKTKKNGVTQGRRSVTPFFFQASNGREEGLVIFAAGRR